MAPVATKAQSGSRWALSRGTAERFCWGVVAYNTLVIVWGAMVRATGSGAGCGNHWPLCNGQVIPVSPSVHTLIEFTHRAMTGAATFAVIGVVLFTFLATSARDMARKFAVASMVLLLNEALLGALLVKLGYVTGNQSTGRVVLLSVHLSNTLLLLAALTLTAVLLGRNSESHLQIDSVQNPVPKAQRFFLSVTALLATMLVGVSGSLAALGDTLFPSSSLRSAIAADLSANAPGLIRVRWVHPASALLAGLCVLLLLRLSWSSSQTSRVSRWVASLLLLQFVLGFADVLLLAPVPMQLLHLLGADLYWIALVTLCSSFLLATQTQTVSTPQPHRFTTAMEDVLTR